MGAITRRTWLARMAVGAIAALGMMAVRCALARGSIPAGVARVKGDARVNGKPALRGMEVRPGDVITTGPGAELIFVVGRDAYLARANTRIELSGDAARLVTQGLRVVTGALLSVFQRGQPKRVQTATATIGIRGTGLYVEVEDKRTYACLCYGEAELTPVDDPAAAEVVRTTHHDQPRYIYARGMPRMMEQAPVVNHTDAELILLEGLVGRKVPFDPDSYR
jgi:hypothetical protein